MARFARTSRTLLIGSTLVFAAGMAVSALSFALLLSFSSPKYEGLRRGGNLTIGEESDGGGSIPTTFSRFEHIRNSARSFASFAAYSRLIALSSDSALSVRSVSAVSNGFFSVFTIPLDAGTSFSDSDERSNNRHVIILSRHFAKLMFSSTRDAVGALIPIRGVPFTVVGVAPTDFSGIFGENVDGWVPCSAIVPLLVENHDDGANAWKEVSAFYILVASETLTTSALAHDISTSLPPLSASESALHVAPGVTDDPARDARLTARVRVGLGLAVAFVLTTALNVALLLLSRAPRESEDIRLKLALGARPSQLAAEAVVGPFAIAMFGLLSAGLLLCGGMFLISRLDGFYGQIGRAAWGSAALAFGAECPFALSLALLISALPVVAVLREARLAPSRYGVTTPPSASVLMRIPVILQISLTTASWILSGMIISSLLGQMNQDLGYSPEGLSEVDIAPATGHFDAEWDSQATPPQVYAFARICDHAARLPGARIAAYASSPISGGGWGSPRLAERADSVESRLRSVQEIAVSPGYFLAVGGRFLEGRDFPPGGGGNEVIVNQTTARELWLNAHCVGRTINVTDAAWGGLPKGRRTVTVVGVVSDIKAPGYGRAAVPAIYTSMYKSGVFDVTPHFLVRSSAEPSALRSALRSVVEAQLPGMTVSAAYRLKDRINSTLVVEAKRSSAALAAALVIAAISYLGLHASLIYYVGGRRRELAIRMCLGATGNDVRARILGLAARDSAVAVILSAPLWPLFSRLSTVQYLGTLSWSTARAVAISSACILVSLSIALWPANLAASTSVSKALKEE